MDRISMCKKKLDIFVVVEHSSLPLKTGQDGRISYNELCGIGQLDLESLNVCMKMMALYSHASF